MAAAVRTTSSSSRIASLDVLRASAIMMVLVYHTPAGWMDGLPFGAEACGHFKRFGWVGVDLFFVLSGWLIGGLYFREEKEFGRVRTGRFWLRRWFRTLPPYYAVLALAYAWKSSTGGEPDIIWREFVFLQNYVYGRGNLVRGSWSLCIEEHFYLALPFLLLLGRRRRKYSLYGIPVIIGVIMLARTATYFHVAATANPNMKMFYQATHFRSETLLIGVWLALAECHFPTMWRAIVGRARPIAVASVATLAGMLVGFILFDADSMSCAFTNTIGYTVVGCAFGGLVVESVSGRSWLARVPRAIAYPIALISYSMYLTHLTVSRDWTYRALDLLPVGIVTIFGFRSFAYFVVTFAVAGMCYLAVERTSMLVRDRVVPRRRLSAETATDGRTPASHGIPASR